MSEHRREPAPTEPCPSRGGGSVLILDDSLTVRMDLADAFAAAGFAPTPCATVAEARALLARQAVDVLILDVLLPDGDGVEFLREVRAGPLGQTAVTLMLSTEAEVKDRVRGLRTGADEYVGKPYDTGYVVAKADELLRTRATRPTDVTTVLIIDDSITFREQLRAACERAGYHVLTGNDGDEGLRLAARHRPSAIVVDGVLPGIDGPTVIRRIRLDAALRSTPCLLLTGSDEPGMELVALDAGADAFARKDHDIAVVLAKLASLIRRIGQSDNAVETVSLLGPKKILAVDDSATYLHELARLLRHEGYDVVPAASGEEALELLAVQPVDCILLDLMMPGLSGEETCRRIKSASVVRDVPLIMLTSLEDRTAMLGALSAGADDYVPKSSEFEVLVARIRAQLRRKQFEDENRRMREELLRTELQAAEARAARELAETRAALVARLEEKNRELEAFSYSVSHDLRAPLRSIDGFSRALLDGHAEGLDDQGADYLRRVRTAAQRMSELIEDLLQLSRIGRAALQRTTVDLTTLAHRITERLHGDDASRAVTVKIEDGLTAEADSQLLEIVFDNLLGNAWKFTAHVPGPIIRVGVERSESDAGDDVFFVRDNGAGFNMRYVERLFRPFQRLHRDDEFPGTGIGLATVHRIIDRHGGRVWATSSPGGGATFHFTVPRARGQLIDEPTAHATAGGSMTTARTK